MNTTKFAESPKNAKKIARRSRTRRKRPIERDETTNDLSSLNEESFVKNLIHGDNGAFEMLVKVLSKPLLGFISQKFVSIPTYSREDILQETLLAVWKALPKFDPGGPAKLTAWILAIAKHKAASYLKQELRRQSREGLEFCSMLDSQTLKALNPRYRRVLTLRLAAGYSLKAITDVENISYDAARKRASRAATSWRALEHAEDREGIAAA